MGLRALLIQKSIKQFNFNSEAITQFESFVNSEEYQTLVSIVILALMFESFVNSEEYQT